MATDITPELTALAQLLGAQYQTTTIAEGAYTYINTFSVERVGPQGRVSVTIRPRRGGKGALMGVLFSIKLPEKVTLAAIEMRAETAIDRFGSALKINREFQSGDAMFDRTVYIESDAPDVTLRRLLSSSVRTQVARVVGDRTLSVEFHPPTVEDGSVAELHQALNGPTVVSIYAPKNSLSDPIMKQVPDWVVALAPAVLQAHQENFSTSDPYGRGAKAVDVHSEHPMPVRTVRGASVMALLAGIGFGGCGFPGPVMLGGGLIPAQIAVGVMLLVMMLVVIVLLLRGRSRSFRDVCVAAIVAGFAAISGGASLTKHLNAALAPEGSSVVSGVATVHSGSKGGKSVWLDVDGEIAYLPGSDAERLGATSSGVGVRVTLRQGGIAGRWIESTEPMRW